MSVVVTGKGEKAGAVLGDRKKEAEREEEEFAVSAARDEDGGKTAEKKRKKGTQVGRKSKKRQFKVRDKIWPVCDVALLFMDCRTRSLGLVAGKAGRRGIPRDQVQTCLDSALLDTARQRLKIANSTEGENDIITQTFCAIVACSLALSVSTLRPCIL